MAQLQRQNRYPSRRTRTPSLHPRTRHVLPRPTTTTTPLEDQIFLSQSLQFLSLLKHNAHPSLGRRCTIENIPKITQDIVEMLDTIALLLTTGPGGVVVAAFDRHVRLSVVLAFARHGDGDGDVTNEHPTPAHHAIIRDFTSLFTNPMIQSVDDIFPYLIKHCGTNMNRCIRKLHNCLSVFASTLDYESADDNNSVLASYTPATSLHLEFPNSERWFSEHHPDADLTSKSTFITILSDLLSTLSDLSSPSFSFPSHSSFNPEPSTSPPLSQSQSHYHTLTAAAHVLLHSRFLNTLIEAYTFSASTSTSTSKFQAHAQADKLKRRLQSICRYDQGITTLILQAKRVFLPCSQIPVRWVVSPDDTTDTTNNQTMIELSATPLEALQPYLLNKEDDDDPNAMDVDPEPSSITLEPVLHTSHPSLFTHWKPHIRPHIHPEIRLALHLTGHPPYSHSHSHSHSPTLPSSFASTPSTTPPSLPIGSTQRLCFACSIWFSSFSGARCVFGWRTSGEALAEWGVPCEDVDDLGERGARTGAGTSIEAGTETGSGTGQATASASASVSIAALRLRVQRGMVKEAVRKEMKGVLAALVNEGGGHGDVYDTETETDVSLESESESEK